MNPDCIIAGPWNGEWVRSARKWFANRVDQRYRRCMQKREEAEDRLGHRERHDAGSEKLTQPTGLQG